MEKFMNIKCRSSGLTPDCIVIVATGMLCAYVLCVGTGICVYGGIMDDYIKEKKQALK